MKITFKNVGQGDSIILDWLEEDIKKIGIIDCCKYANRNPVIDFLESEKSYNIEFIILSHPHKDHYSGMLGLLEYLEEKNIEIKRFVHTSCLTREYIKWYSYVEVKLEDIRELERIVKTAIRLHDDKKLIKGIEYAIANWSIYLGKNYILRAFAPSDDDFRRFTKKVEYFVKDKNFAACSSAANYLSSVMLIVN